MKHTWNRRRHNCSTLRPISWNCNINKSNHFTKFMKNIFKFSLCLFNSLSITFPSLDLLYCTSLNIKDSLDSRIENKMHRSCLLLNIRHPDSNHDLGKDTSLYKPSLVVISLWFLYT